MDDWRIQQQRINTNGIGPIHSYHSLHSRPSPYQINEIKQTYPYQQTSAISVKTDSNSDVYTPLPYTPTQMEQIHHQQQQQQQQRIITSKSAPGPISNYHPGHQQIMSARTRSMPYPSPSMYATHSSATVCQCNSHTHYPSQHQMFYSNYYQSQPLSYQQNTNITRHEMIKNKIKSKTDEPFQSSTSYYTSNCSNSYIPSQQLQSQTSSISQEYQTYSNQSQIFPSPPSNPSTPYQGEFNGNTEFGVPYHQSQPSSVNSLTDALCPSGDTVDRQMTPGPPSVGTPRVAQHQYSFPQTPLTPTTSRLTNEQNIDELTAFLQDPINTYLTEDLTSTLFDDIEALADTYLGGRGSAQQSNIDTNLDYDIILNYLCSDDLISTMYKN
ncbi:unnamed protein product [Rotaria sp. Silwood1]|nr:unnamed protein product [Rotaria sp. Silwood1]CAF1189680.1 unnamed protein product [Rotaria sp. Silwood1]CAF4551632.1 unnamed protein product [Rotaria sp. Silwood1]